MKKIIIYGLIVLALIITATASKTIMPTKDVIIPDNIEDVDKYIQEAVNEKVIKDNAETIRSIKRNITNNIIRTERTEEELLEIQRCIIIIVPDVIETPIIETPIIE
jgi:hypothetical protein